MGFPNDTVQGNQYTSEGTHNFYQLDPGVCVLPLAEDPPTNAAELLTWSPVVILRLHAPYRIRKYSHVADKRNNPPPLPSSEDSGAFVFMSGGVSIKNMVNTSFSNYDWSVNCEYFFVENCVSREQDGYVLGNPVFTLRTATVNARGGGAISLIGDTINPSTGELAGAAGAIVRAGQDAIVGYRQGQEILGNQSNGVLKRTWGYNVPVYYPGTLIYSELVNCGPPILNIPQSQG